MVDQWTGEWTEEKDYSKYPKEKMVRLRLHGSVD